MKMPHPDESKTRAELMQEVQALRQQLKLRTLQQQILASTAKDLLRELKLESLWESVWQAVETALEGDGTAVYYYQPDTILCPYAHNLSHGYVDELNRHFDYTKKQQWQKHRQPIVVDDILLEESANALRPALICEGFRAYAIFPFIAPDQKIASLAIYRQKPQPFTVDDVATGEVLAHLVGIALQNVQYFGEHNRALQREQQLNEMTRILNGSLDLPTVLSNVVRIATELVQADAGALGLIVEDDKMFFYPYKMPPSTQLNPMTRGRGLAWEIVQNGRSIHLNNYATHEKAQKVWVDAGIHGFIGVPIIASNECLGALGLFTMNPQLQFDPRDIAVAESVGRQAGVVIQNAYLYTESQRRNETLRHALAKQEELDELKSGFIRNVSHELRTPLGLIYGHASLLASGVLGDLTEEQSNSMQIIARRSTMLKLLVEDLTAMLAVQAFEIKYETIEVASFLHSIVDDFQLLAEEHQIHLASNIEANLGQLQGATTHLRRVFDNLLSNAFKFTPVNGKIWLEAWSEDKQLIIEVGDNGIGIPSDQLHRVFERFYQVDRTTRRKFGGTGLGLAVVKEITEAHGGQVTITSAENEGTQFRLTFPLVDHQ